MHAAAKPSCSSTYPCVEHSHCAHEEARHKSRNVGKVVHEWDQAQQAEHSSDKDQ